jgi:hypothetical protein
MSTINPQADLGFYFVLKTRAGFYTLIHSHYYYLFY